VASSATEAPVRDLRGTVVAALRAREARAERKSWQMTLRRLADAVAGTPDPPPPFQSRRRRLLPEQQLAIFRRDGYVCRYCGAPTVHPAALRALAWIMPETFPYDPHWRRGRSHSLFGEIAAAVDHVVPLSRGGAFRDAGNLVTSCARCQRVKGVWLPEELRWTVRPPDGGGWNGLEDLFLALFRREMEELAEWRDAMEALGDRQGAAGASRLPALPSS
jgi:5-methylcytosine-specific restriction endonuclease McrA